jgi:hypothetical protein
MKRYNLLNNMFGDFGEREWEFRGVISWEIRNDKLIISLNPTLGVRWEFVGS